MAILNLAVGIGVAVMGLFIGFTDALAAVGPTQSSVALTSCLIFALTYILLAAEIFYGTDFKALGWYCCMGGIVMFLISLGFCHVIGNTLIFSTQFSLFWFLWAVLFWLFWACWGLGKTSLAKFTGYYTIFVAIFTSLLQFLHVFIQPRLSSLWGKLAGRLDNVY
jgi:hypothetical protein